MAQMDPGPWRSECLSASCCSFLMDSFLSNRMNSKPQFLRAVSIRALACLAVLLVADTIVPETLRAQQRVGDGQLPTFADYPAKGKFKGKPARAKIRTKDARMYRTAITEGAKEGPNFAGHYTIVQWGCGTACLGFAIVDANTGRVTMAPFYVGMGYDLSDELKERDLIEYKLDSRLLIVTGTRDDKGQGQYFYAWDGKRLKLVRTEYEIKE